MRNFIAQIKMQIGNAIGLQLAPAMTISGVPYYTLSEAETVVLTGFRLIASQGAGSMIVELRDWQVVKWDVHPNLGGAATLNAALGTTTKLRG